jgi:glutamate-1-semialdehyde 2,1-aminomutase
MLSLPANKRLLPRACGSAQEGAVLCFDEVMTGFRIAKGCAQEYFGVTPDLTTMGKVIGGGLPVGAYGGKKEIMQMVAPAGPMYQVGSDG